MTTVFVSQDDGTLYRESEIDRNENGQVEGFDSYEL